MSMRTASRTRGADLPATPQPPVYLTPLVGRDVELAEVVRLLRTGRLVSLVGTGGTGKTRLAAAVAVELRDRHRASVAWVDLAAVPDDAVVARHTAASLGMREQPGIAAADALVEVIRDAAVLLVLDNCEHVIAASAALVDTLLRGCPALRIITTSRQALGLPGEKAWLVPPLALPTDAAAAASSGAVQLFVQRATDVLPTFTLTPANTAAVVRICRRLDGLPLAIELAAARVRLLPPEQLASRLDDVFGLLTSGSAVALPRHRTLRALIDWSYDLMSADERRLCARLAVFAGGFTLEAAEAVVSDGTIAADAVLDLLAALVDKSIVGMREWNGEARYSLLETVRQYAREKLDAQCDECDVDFAGTVRGRHASYYAQLAERAALQLHRPAQPLWLARLDAEHDNLLAALAWCTAAGDAELALRLCLGLRDFWRLRGHLSEGRGWTEHALALPGATGVLRARALVAAAVFARMQSEHALYRERLGEGEALARALNDRIALAGVLTQLGVDLRDRGELGAAADRLDEAITLWRELGDSWGLSLALGARAAIAISVGDAAAARALREEAVAVSRRAGDREGEARGLIGLGELARQQGDGDVARAYYDRSLALFREFGDIWHIAAVHQNLGWIDAENGRLAEAAAAFRESIALFTLAGTAFGLTLCLVGLARVLHESGDSASAATALAAALRHSEHLHMRPVPADAAAWDRTRAVVEAALEPPVLVQAWAHGVQMEPPECLAWVEERLAAVTPRASQATSHTASPAPTPTTPPVEPRRALHAAEPSAADVRVRALGPLRIFVHDQPLDGDAFGSTKPRELFLLLLLHTDGCTREQVGLAFWPDASAAQVKNSFHVTLHRLRKAIGHADWIVLSGDRYRLEPSLCIDFDVPRFEEKITAALRADANGGDVVAQMVHAEGTAPNDAPSLASAADRDCTAQLEAALALYAGDFLDGEIVGDWHLEIRYRLRRLHTAGLLALGRRLIHAGRYGDAADAYRALLARDPLHEEACRSLMLCHARTGDRAQALRLFDSFTVLLREELGTTPDGATTALYHEIQRGPPV